MGGQVGTMVKGDDAEWLGAGRSASAKSDGGGRSAAESGGGGGGLGTHWKPL